MNSSAFECEFLLYERKVVVGRNSELLLYELQLYELFVRWVQIVEVSPCNLMVGYNHFHNLDV